MRTLDAILNKIVSVEVARATLATWKSEHKKVVFTNGCFDILHQGHVTYLAHAADFGTKLVLGLNSDASVINDEVSRAILLASLSFIDLVVIFDEDTPLNIISQIRPDILVKGADYDASESDPTSSKYIVGSDIVRGYGGDIKTVPLVEGFSTTSILKRIKN
jgi:rfaE bifunctional protein nucleotidyltransferase chain/domain